jgi:hypothetical protein
LTFQSLGREESSDMLAILLGLFSPHLVFGKSHECEVLQGHRRFSSKAGYLQAQEEAHTANPFWILLGSIWKEWRRALFGGSPGDTVVRWQRQRFRGYWAELSKKCATLGRPPIGKEIRELIQTTARANPL